MLIHMDGEKLFYSIDSSGAFSIKLFLHNL